MQPNITALQPQRALPVLLLSQRLQQLPLTDRKGHDLAELPAPQTLRRRRKHDLRQRTH